jgi:predicted nucleotidyltransferase
MRIDPKDRIAGVPILAVRGFFNSVGGRLFSQERLAGELGLPQQQAAVVLDTLVSEGYVEWYNRPTLGSTPELHGPWRTTVKGNALAGARASAPVRRAVAERHLAAFLERVRAANAHFDFCYWVEQVVLFGSLLDPTREHVSDVDLAVQLVSRYSDQQERVHAQLRRANLANPRFGSSLDRVLWAQTEVLLYLKNRSRVLALVEPDAVPLDAPQRVIYRRSDQGVHELFGSPARTRPGSGDDTAY